MTILRVASGSSILELDSHGAYVKTLMLSGKEILMDSTDGVSTHGGCTLLIPYANRVRNASYRWRGKDYYLPKNNGQHSIHGFTRDMEWEVLSESASDTLSLRTEVEREDYPSKLECESCFRLSEKFLEISLSFLNSGSMDLPLSVGFHPYFLHDGYWKIEAPSEIKILNYGDSYFPDGTTSDFDSGLLTSTNPKELDNCFHVGSNLTLITKNYKIAVHNENMEYFVIYNGEYSRGSSVAIEPMTSAPDAFNNGIGLIKLSPNDKFSCSTRFTLS